MDRLESLHQGLYLGAGGTSTATLSSLWSDHIWKETSYQDTRPPSFVSRQVSLWNLGGTYISSAREVAFAALNGLLAVSGAGSGGGGGGVPSAGNVTLLTDRFWLYVHSNAGGSLSSGYLRIINNSLLVAQDNVNLIKEMLLIFIGLECCGIGLAAALYVVWLLWGVTRARSALFSVFLVIPGRSLKKLANKNVTVQVSCSDKLP